MILTLIELIFIFKPDNIIYMQPNVSAKDAILKTFNGILADTFVFRNGRLYVLIRSSRLSI